MPARKPSQLKKLTGTYRADRAPGKEAEPEAAASLRTPKGLSKHAAAFWRRYAAELSRAGTGDGAGSSRAAADGHDLGHRSGRGGAGVKRRSDPT